MLTKNFPLRLFHIDEICSVLGVNITNIIGKPEHYGEILGRILRGDVDAGIQAPQPIPEKKSILKSVVSFFGRK
jgi:hypothetical protein